MMLYITVLFSPSRSAAPLLKTFLTKIPKSAPRADLPPAIFIPCNKNKKQVIILIIIKNRTLQRILNPLTPKSDEHLISPQSTTTESGIKVTKKKEMIAN